MESGLAIPAGESFEMTLPTGTLKEDTNYILSIGLDLDRRLERFITFKGSAPRLAHTFEDSARVE